MDTEYDFITPEFMHLLFFKQKNLVIYPHVDVKHLRGLETFTVGYTLVDMECTALYNFKDILQMPSDGNSKNFYLIYGLDKKKASELIELEEAHCILNVSESMADVMADGHDDFVFYNKKTGKFLNYNFDEEEIKFEHMIISLAKDPERVKTELLKIKGVAFQLYKGINRNSAHLDIPLLLKDYNEEEYPKIFEFTENFYEITIPEKITEQKPRFTPNTSNQARFVEEFKAISSVNQKYTEELIKMLHEYKQNKVNPSNLELAELHTPMLLYDYLRNHHWTEGIPMGFLERWSQMEHTRYDLSDEDIEDFSIILEKIGLKKRKFNKIITSIESIEEKDAIQAKTINSESKVEKSNQKYKETEINDQQNNYEAVSIANIEQFKTEVFGMLDEIESHISIYSSANDISSKKN
jgi:hypothetical protein